MMETWQKGYELDYLKSITEVFTKTQKYLVFGAFGLVKERDVANSSFVTVGRPISGVALWSVLKHNSRNVLFDGRELIIPSGAVLIKDIAAYSTQYAKETLSIVDSKFENKFETTSVGFFKKPKETWVEIFEEDLNIKNAVMLAGFSYVGTKITAGSEIKGLYVKNPNIIHYYNNKREELASLVEINSHYINRYECEFITQELFVNNFWKQHYSSYNKRKSWTSFCLRGYDKNDPRFIIKPAEMSLKWKSDNTERLKAKPTDTVIYDKFPVTKQIVDSLPGEKDRVRFMRLRHQDGELTRHADITDRDAGVANGKVARLHIPIITSPNVQFHSWDARGNEIVKSFKAGSLFYLDQRKPHAVTNTDPTIDRIHLVVDCFSTPQLREMLV